MRIFRSRSLFVDHVLLDVKIKSDDIPRHCHQRCLSIHSYNESRSYHERISNMTLSMKQVPLLIILLFLPVATILHTQQGSSKETLKILETVNEFGGKTVEYTYPDGKRLTGC